ncbi:MAG TPA: GNAT family protein, partial [Polyangiaceae bacterium]|nr:GNAT family protein [Polyangiaceae bacterium]
GDVETAYAWHADLDIEIASGWGRRQSLTTFRHRFEALLASPPAEHRIFGIVVGGALIGRIDLSLVDAEHRHAALGFFLGAREFRGRGHAKTAVRIMLDYAFTVENLERVYAHVYGFNARSIGLMKSAGFVAEGVLRQHEVHNGRRQDMHVFGMLKPEFYARHRTLFEPPADLLAP